MRRSRKLAEWFKMRSIRSDAKTNYERYMRSNSGAWTTPKWKSNCRRASARRKSSLSCNIMTRYFARPTLMKWRRKLSVSNSSVSSRYPWQSRSTRRLRVTRSKSRKKLQTENELSNYVMRPKMKRYGICRIKRRVAIESLMWLRTMSWTCRRAWTPNKNAEMRLSRCTWSCTRSEAMKRIWGGASSRKCTGLKWRRHWMSKPRPKPRRNSV